MREMFRKPGLLRAFFVIAIPVLLLASSSAQTYRGAIKGRVQNEAGRAVAGASVQAKNDANGTVRDTVSDSDGGFSIPELAAGNYSVIISANGFAPTSENIGVEVGATTSLPVNLSQVKGEAITVTGAVPLIDTARDTLEQVVDNRLVAELPLNGRDFTKLVALTPGVTVEGSGVAGTEKGFGQFNINGNRDRSNNYMLDGTDNNDPFFNNSALNQVGITGAPASLLPIDAIQEFNLQSQFAAEYGRNSGSAVNILTKSGTNRIHGSAFEFFRNDRLNARNYFNPPPNAKSAFRNNQFGASLGGPIVHDHTFFFAAFEGQRERVGSNFIVSVPTSAQIADARATASGILGGPVNPALDNILSFFPAPSGFNGTSGTVATTVSDKNDLNSFIVKADQQFSENETFSVRYAYGDSTQTFPLGSLGGFGSGSRLAQFAQQSPTRVQVLSGSLLSVLSSGKVNEVRVGYSRYRTSFHSLDRKLDPASLGFGNLDTGELGLPEIDFSGLIENLGATAFSVPRGRVSQTYQALDNFTWVNGRNSWKIGGEYRRANIDSFNDNLERGLISFSSGNGFFNDPVTDMLTSYYLGGPSSFAGFGNTGNTHRNTFNNGFSAFAQDDFRASAGLTLNLGLRWEYFGPLGETHNLLSNLDPATGLLHMVKLPYNRDLNNFAPRIGFAYAPVDGFVLRGGYGLYYDYIPQNLLIANFTNSAGLVTNPIGSKPVFPLNFDPSAWAGTVATSVFSANTSGPFSVFVTPRNLATPYVQGWNLNLQKQLGKTFSLETGYVGSKGTHLTRLFDANQSDAQGNLPNANFAAEDVFATNAVSSYHALQVTGRARSWQRLSGFATWTYSKSLDDASDGIDFNFASAAFPQDSTNLQAERGPSTFDTRHRFTAALNYQLPEFSALPRALASGWQLNVISTLQSGRPIPIVTSNDTSGRFNFHQRPDVVPGVNPILSHWRPDTGYLNPLAFRQPADGTFGNLGRNAIFGPGFVNLDFSVSKNTHISEQLELQLRAEFFNVLNHPNFALPGGTIEPGLNADGTINTNSGPTGLITQTPDVAQGNPGLGGGGPRVIQLSVRLSF